MAKRALEATSATEEGKGLDCIFVHKSWKYQLNVAVTEKARKRKKSRSVRKLELCRNGDK